MDTRLPFWKYHGLGNDFVLIESELRSDTAKAICDRSFGIGADGVLEVTTSSEDLAGAVKVWNADGSEAEICGNGLRCVALHLVNTEKVNEDVLTLATGAGNRTCRVIEHEPPGRGVIEVMMGTPELDRASVPVRGDGRMIEQPLEIEGRQLLITAVGMGNPHAVMFDDFSSQDVATLGPILETHSIFPAGVNAGFAAIVGTDRLKLTVWERGAGLTGACGSGACAAAVAACETGRMRRGTPIYVDQPGGTLVITVDPESQEITMRGPAQLVYSGTLDVSLLPLASAFH